MNNEEEMAILYYYNRRYRRRRRRFWVHPYIERNIHCRLFVAAVELQQDDGKFHSFYRMSKETYKLLVNRVRPALIKTNTNMRECVSPEERIMITLRYLATGSTFVALGLYFARGDCTVSKIVAETTQVIWEILKDDYMAIPSIQAWKNTADRFYELWNIPNCLGAIDGKHIRIKKLPNSGSTNYNYKNFHSIVLMACSDANGLFTIIETGFAGRNSDGGIFRAGRMKEWIERNGNIPPPSRLPHDPQENYFPYYFVADEAFALLKYLMRPYPQRSLNNKKRIFNYRLSRGRKTVECAFGMAAQKFQILETSILCRSKQTVIYIVKCVCILHNFVRKNEGTPYALNTQEPQDNPDRVILQMPQENAVFHIDNRTTSYNLRDYLANYFLTPQAQLPWQWNLIP